MPRIEDDISIPAGVRTPGLDAIDVACSPAAAGVSIRYMYPGRSQDLGLDADRCIEPALVDAGAVVIDTEMGGERGAEMKCPKCSENKKLRKLPALRTVRTMANGRSARRERVCPKCKGRWWTREFYEEDYKAELERYALAAGEAAQERDAAKRACARVAGTIRDLVEFARE